MDISNRNQSIIEKRYVRNVLQAAGSRIKTQQEGVLNKSKGVSKNLLDKRTIAITSDSKLTMYHLLTQRFIDMKRLSGIKNPVYTPLHNKVIMGNFLRIQSELQYGFTQEVKNKIAGSLKIEL